MQDKENLEESVDVAMTAIGNLLEFGTGIVVHADDCSYLIHNDMMEDGEMFNVITTRYTHDDVSGLEEYSTGEILTMIKDGDSIKPSLSIVK